jgi:tRNA dimethylallyltransferase
VDLPKLAVLAGPTASGKTDLGIELALALGAEIISADSQQVYRHFDLGTAKPSGEQLARVKHHLVSHVDPFDQMDAARWAQQAAAVLAKAAADRKPVLVVGGTGLYVRALVYGVIEGPGRDEAFRAALAERIASEGLEAIHAELARKDPASGARIHTTDRLRIERALEMQHLTGRTASELRAEHGFSQARYRLWGRWLHPEREVLFDRINRRAALMFERGLLDETRGLLDQGFGAAPPMGSIGYAQAKAVLDGTMTLDVAREDLAQSTRRYAKRQESWFRKETWMTALPRADPDALLASLRAFLAE